MEVRAKKHRLSNRDFAFICDLVYRNAGIVLTQAKKEMVYRRLMRRTCDLNIDSFSQYCDLIRSPNNDELSNFINSITTNHTSFFREKHHFDYLKKKFIPQHIREFRADPRLRIWSSACSTGEEAYSLSIVVQQVMSTNLSGWDVKILATDLDTDAINTGKEGVYDIEKIKSLPMEVQRRWFTKGKRESKGLVKVKPEIQELIFFKQLNLLENWPMRGYFDVILCRNVLIYFDKGTQKKLLERFTKLLRPGGVLMLGHSENINKECSGLSPIGRTMYQKHRILH